MSIEPRKARTADPIPEGRQHDKIDDNGAAHIKAAVIGPSTTVPVQHGRLLLGTWQAIMLVEFDGPRERHVMVTLQPSLSGR